MTEAELRAKYNTAYRIIQRERQMREQVFRDDPAARTQKVGEMDCLLRILTELKDELKPHMAVTYEQPTLLDVPTPTKYG